MPDIMTDDDNKKPNSASAAENFSDNEGFPGNWVTFSGDYNTDGVWTAGGLFSLAQDLPIPDEMREEIRSWGFSYRSPAHTKPEYHALAGQKHDGWGFELARKVSELLPHWTVAFRSDFGTFKTPSGQSFGIVCPNGSFEDLTEKQKVLRTRLSVFEGEH